MAHRIKGSTRKDRATSAIESIMRKYDEIDSKTIKSFDDIPLSNETQRGLKSAGFTKPTDIQRQSIGVALRGSDVLGAAITGSGKTLAFLIPVLELLWRNTWSHFDGLGALIISPTRELAMQIYEVLRKVGCYHNFSAALIVGGTDVHYEAKRLSGKNIIVCTPGRLLQHMDENPNFNCDNMKILVIDEADRILDLGFERQVNAIVSSLPSERQTLLFSATQTTSVKDLARLSLKDPVYIFVHEHAKYSTPAQLKQSYTICEEHEKLNMLWSFIKSHQHHKVLVFMSNCKQVRFIFESFRRLRPHTTLLSLYGSMAQMKRVNVYQQFCNKQHVVLLATDIAARGLDFPAVDWVLQLDCPSDANEYIHRSGRTARYERNGESLLVLTPTQEEAMIEELKSKKIPISKITINPAKLMNIQKKLETFCTQDAKLKVAAQRAFVAIVRSIFLMGNKKVFDVKQMNYEALARSYGLAVTPRIRFLRKQPSGKDGTAYSKPSNPVNEMNHDGSEQLEAVSTDDGTVLDVRPKNIDEGFHGLLDNRDEDQTDDLFTIKRQDIFNAAGSSHLHEEDEDEEPSPEETQAISTRKKPLTRAAMAKKILKKKILANKKLVFDEEGKISNPNTITKSESSRDNDDGYRIEIAKRVMAEEDKIDFQNYRKRIKEKHKEEKRKRKLAEMEKRQGKQTAGKAVLGGPLVEDEEPTYEEDNTNDDVSSEGSEERDMEKQTRRPPKNKKRRLTKAELSDDGLQLQQDYSDINLADAEELALKLLDS